MDVVEYIVKKNLGVGLLDLPDEMYRKNFENGISYQITSEQAINNNIHFI